MKDFAEAYREAHAKAREYMGAKRAGWAEPGKRTRDNHAILVPRREAVAMADGCVRKGSLFDLGAEPARVHGTTGDW